MTTYDCSAVVAEVFRTMLGLEVRIPSPEPLPAEAVLTGAVYLAGSWQGVVLFQCPRPVACTLFSRLMGGPVPSAVDDDVRDAVGELTNTIGGNLKALLPPGSVLSVPSVVDGDDYSVRVKNSNPVTSVSISFSEGHASITVLEITRSVAVSG